MENDPIFVTQPTLPPLKDFIPYLEKIWESKVLTNGGAFHQQLESALCEYLGVPFISLFNNGTIALLTALQAMDLQGEVITTPYTFVATANAIVWNRLTPVFVDIDPVTYNLDPKQLETAITERTSAILPVHCYGTPCDVDSISAIAKRHDLKVIYDAAHAFGVRCHCGQSVLNHGDLSILSFHATKVFNTFEGGAIVSHSKEMKQKIDRLKNFGFVNETSVVLAGINGKMSEVNAAFGLLQLRNIDAAIARRRTVAATYRMELADLESLHIPPSKSSGADNASYFPVFVRSPEHGFRDKIYEALKEKGIWSRRYFYPLLTDFPMFESIVSNNKSVYSHAHAAAENVLCLPISSEMDEKMVGRVTSAIKRALA